MIPKNLDRDQSAPELSANSIPSSTDAARMVGLARHQVLKHPWPEPITKQCGLSHASSYRPEASPELRSGREAPPPSRWPIRAIRAVVTVTPITLSPTFHQLVDDNIKHTGIGHNTGRTVQRITKRMVGPVLLKPPLDQIADLLDGIVSANYQDQSQDGRKNNECHTRHVLL